MGKGVDSNRSTAQHSDDYSDPPVEIEDQSTRLTVSDSTWRQRPQRPMEECLDVCRSASSERLLASFFIITPLPLPHRG